MIILLTNRTAVNDKPCGNKFTMTNSFGLEKDNRIDLIALIVWHTVSGDFFLIATHDPVGGLTHMIKDSFRAQKLTHLHFSAIAAAVRSRSARRVLSPC
jgi:hypothetical protein